jgi:hypothetical protein
MNIARLLFAVSLVLLGLGLVATPDSRWMLLGVGIGGLFLAYLAAMASLAPLEKDIRPLHGVLMMYAVLVAVGGLASSRALQIGLQVLGLSLTVPVAMRIRALLLPYESDPSATLSACFFALVPLVCLVMAAYVPAPGSGLLGSVGALMGVWGGIVAWRPSTLLAGKDLPPDQKATP